MIHHGLNHFKQAIPFGYMLKYVKQSDAVEVFVEAGDYLLAVSRNYVVKVMLCKLCGLW